jgi:hypothetical protein
LVLYYFIPFFNCKIEENENFKTFAPDDSEDKSERKPSENKINFEVSEPKSQFNKG